VHELQQPVGQVQACSKIPPRRRRWSLGGAASDASGPADPVSSTLLNWWAGGDQAAVSTRRRYRASRRKAGGVSGVFEAGSLFGRDQLARGGTKVIAPRRWASARGRRTAQRKFLSANFGSSWSGAQSGLRVFTQESAGSHLPVAAAGRARSSIRLDRARSRRAPWPSRVDKAALGNPHRAARCRSGPASRRSASAPAAARPGGAFPRTQPRVCRLPIVPPAQAGATVDVGKAKQVGSAQAGFSRLFCLLSQAKPHLLF